MEHEFNELSESMRISKIKNGSEVFQHEPAGAWRSTIPMTNRKATPSKMCPAQHITIADAANVP